MAHRELHGRLKIAQQQAEMYKEAMAYLMTPPRDAHGTPALEHDYSSSAITSPPVGQNRSSLTSTAALSDSTLRASVTRTLLEGHGEGHEERMAISREGSTELSSEATSPLDVSDYEGGGQEPSGVSSFSDVMLMSRSASSANRFSKVGWFAETVEGQPGWMSTPDAKGECRRLTDELQKVQRRRTAVGAERDALARRTAELSRCRSHLLSRGISLVATRSDIANARESCRIKQALYEEQLVSAMNMDALNDSFHIWHKGPFATINGFRVGRLPSLVVDWQEVNAGVGQAALVLVTVAMAMGVEFSKYLIAPCGSFTKIARSEDGRVLYSLHTDESFSLFPRRNFNLALKAFLHCLARPITDLRRYIVVTCAAGLIRVGFVAAGEVGEYVQDHDPTLRLPYRIKEKDGTVGGLPVSLGSSLEDWTRALKYMMTDLKWIVAWAAKYLPPC